MKFIGWGADRLDAKDQSKLILEQLEFAQIFPMKGSLNGGVCLQCDDASVVILHESSTKVFVEVFKEKFGDKFSSYELDFHEILKGDARAQLDKIENKDAERWLAYCKHKIGPFTNAYRHTLFLIVMEELYDLDLFIKIQKFLINMRRASLEDNKYAIACFKSNSFKDQYNVTINGVCIESAAEIKTAVNN